MCSKAWPIPVPLWAVILLFERKREEPTSKILIEQPPRTDVVGLPLPNGNFRHAERGERNAVSERQEHSEREKVKFQQPHAAGQIVVRRMHCEGNGAREQDANIEKVVQALEQRRGVREEVDLIKKECSKSVVRVQITDHFPGVIIRFERVCGQIEGVLVLEDILPEQNGLSRPPRTHDPGEMLALQPQLSA